LSNLKNIISIYTGYSNNFEGMLPSEFIRVPSVAAEMGENTVPFFSPNHGTTGTSPVGTTFAISTPQKSARSWYHGASPAESTFAISKKIYEEPIPLY